MKVRATLLDSKSSDKLLASSSGSEKAASSSELNTDESATLDASSSSGPESRGLPEDIFLSWKKETVSTICNKLSEGQRSALIFELLGRLPAKNRLFLVRNLQKIATVDFVSQLPYELSLSILRYLDPTSLLTATRVSRHWNKLINSECVLWKDACLYLRITLAYSSTQSASYYRDKAVSYLAQLRKLGTRSGCKVQSVSDVAKGPAHVGRALALSVSTERIYSGGEDRFIRCWERESGVLVREREGNVTSCIDCTEQIVAAGFMGGCLQVYTASLFQLLCTCSRHMGPVYDVKCTRDSNFLVSGSSDCTVRVWETAGGACQHVFRGHETMISKVLILEDRVFSLDIACLKVWSISDKVLLRDLKPISHGGKEGYFLPGLVSAHMLTNTGQRRAVVVNGSSHGVYFWDSNTFELLRIVRSPGYGCTEHIVGVGSAFIAATLDDGLALINNQTGSHEVTIHVSQFNNSSCGLWLDGMSGWLDGRFTDEQSLFAVTTLAGDISSFYART